jgi:hypothetical protein
MQIPPDTKSFSQANLLLVDTCAEDVSTSLFCNRRQKSGFFSLLILLISLCALQGASLAVVVVWRWVGGGRDARGRGTIEPSRTNVITITAGT